MGLNCLHRFGITFFLNTLHQHSQESGCNHIRFTEGPITLFVKRENDISSLFESDRMVSKIPRKEIQTTPVTYQHPNCTKVSIRKIGHQKFMIFDAKGTSFSHLTWNLSSVITRYLIENLNANNYFYMFQFWNVQPPKRRSLQGSVYIRCNKPIEHPSANKTNSSFHGNGETIDKRFTTTAEPADQQPHQSNNGTWINST